MNVSHGPVGRLIRGHVLDVSLKPFLRALKDYDKQLYVEWNPKKLKGEGCWEIRRLPTKKRAMYQGSHNGAKYYKLMFVEQGNMSHILDAAFLNYDILRKLQEIDTFRLVERSGYGSLDALLDAKQKEATARQTSAAADRLKYAIKSNKSAMRDFYEMVKSGVNPAEVLTSIKWDQT